MKFKKRKNSLTVLGICFVLLSLFILSMNFVSSIAYNNDESVEKLLSIHSQPLIEKTKMSIYKQATLGEEQKENFFTRIFNGFLNLFRRQTEKQENLDDSNLNDRDTFNTPNVYISESKIVNNQDSLINGQLSMIIQKNSGGSWNNYQNLVLNENIIISPKSYFDLAELFNSKNLVLSEVGDYRIYTVFKLYSQEIEFFEEFSVYQKILP
ncbi:MAG: hypothetical protein ABIH65_02210 [Nanoarchaeota archaeon]